MLNPEVEEGNKEYKRYIQNLSPHRFEQLVSQMKWRIEEGDGFAYYYLGVNDDGSIYGIDNKEFKNSIKNISKIVKKCNAKINKVDKIKSNEKFYYIIKIVLEINNKYIERRVLLLGDTGVGKTTFLAYLINNKLNNNSRIFILNHKHELETGKTSSFNYKYLIYDNIKYVFLDTPGDNLYNKTLNRVLLSLDIDLILYFEGDNKWSLKNLYYQYAIFKKIGWIELDIYSSINRFPKINMKNPPNKNVILKYLHNNLINKNDESSNKNTNFIILQTYPHQDLGWILSGFLESGKINIGDELIWYGSKKMNVSIQSIHVNNIPVTSIDKKQIVTLCLDKLKDIKEKPKYGFLSNINIDSKRTIVIEWIHLEDYLEDKINGFIQNNRVTILKIGRRSDTILIYHLINFDHIFNLKNNVFLFAKGFGKII